MKIFIIILSLFFSRAQAGNPSLGEVRKLYQASAVAEDSCRKLIDILQAYDEKSNPLMTGYYACATMMMAGYLINPFAKLEKFNTGKSLLEKCIEASSLNPELHFLRLSMQCSAPAFLSYKESIDEDKKLVLKSLPAIDDMQLRSMVIAYLKNSNCLDDTEKNKIK